VPLYAAGRAAKDGLRRVGVSRTRKLRRPVVSVGSLSAGGAGKTPVVIVLAELLRGCGFAVDVLSRGYGREGAGVERVDPNAADAARRFGDEPVVIAQRTGVPVWVGAERFAAGIAAEASSGRVDAGRGVHLLDDGFQHRQLARAVDVVVVTEEDLDDALLPAGNRREPLAALRRADVVVLREEERGRIEARVRARMREGATIWTVQRTVEVKGATDGIASKCAVVAFCGIARPEDFVDTLRNEGARVVDSVAFPDHHRYTAEDMQQLTESLQARTGEAFITTEKDAVKITPELRAQLEAAAPVLVARLQAIFADSQQAVRELEARLR
jgi:tetraacyldisaccharide 4'-kinase